MIKNISIDQKECIGCGICVCDFPEILEVDPQDFKCKIKEDGKLVDSASIVLSLEQINKIKKTTENCPVLAIKSS